MGEQSITVTPHTLGLYPYTLIELRPSSDDPAEPSLHIEAGGGAQEQPTYMPLLVVTEQQAGPNNALATMLREVATEHGSAEATRAIEEIVEQINSDWQGYVFRVGE